MKNTPDEIVEILAAKLNNKDIEFADASGQWLLSTRTSVGLLDNFAGDDYEYRIKPSPQWRAWTASEVPVGAIVRAKNCIGYGALILSVHADTKTYTWANYDCTIKSESINSLLGQEYSTDGGKTWNICGVQIQ